MFSSLFLLLFNLLLISHVIDQTSAPFLKDKAGFAFGLFLLSNLFLWMFFYRQNTWLKKKFFLKKEPILFITNLEILLFFCFFYFFLGAHRWLINHLGSFALTGFSLFSLSLYFMGLWMSHYSIERSVNPPTASKQASLATAFLLPFVIPFLLIAFTSEVSNFIPLNKALNLFGLTEDGVGYLLLFTFFNLAVIASTVIFLPPLAVLIWQCSDLNDSELKTELDALCKRANFRHAGFKIWKIMNHSMTAAIMGIVKRLRYILFTQKLLDHLPNKAIVAILAHEIGHSYYLHLFIYPFIFFGMVIIGSLVPLVIYVPILQHTHLEERFPEIFSGLYFLFLGLIMALYFRFVFGYFSRIFERQADLHIFHLEIPSNHLVEALDTLAVLAGNIHLQPNWHHYSIQERIDFINRADKNKSLISQHTRRVKLSLFFYFIALILSSGALWYFI